MGDQPTMPIPETPSSSQPDATQVMPTVPDPTAQTASPPAGPPPSPTPQAGPGDGDGKRRSSLVLVVVVVAILVIGACGAAYIVQKRRADALEQRVTEAEEQVQDLMSSQAESPPAGSSDSEDPEEADSEPEPEPEPDPEPEPAVDPDDGTFIGVITDIYNDGATRYIEIDYIQFLTGDDAAAAATARGDESPPPNDYYIVNENPMLRDLPVETGLHVTMWTWDMANSGVQEDSILFDIWWDEIEMHMRDELLHNPYWIEIEDGLVTSIEEQFLP